ncbi:hypothetical protein JKP88DRAFT_273071 [Tribonema minus]|uniref:Uncharacterized protein n=1 Tax=Tribonema minus TaxID=303371 RepID=A0A835YX38_9STRA|nr:hypothetical protein JKP88DRAFT_273071 [Tribonema minus]
MAPLHTAYDGFYAPPVSKQVKPERHAPEEQDAAPQDRGGEGGGSQGAPLVPLGAPLPPSAEARASSAPAALNSSVEVPLVALLLASAAVGAALGFGLGALYVRRLLAPKVLRAFVADVGDFGDVIRTDLLGLDEAPVVSMDDGTLRGAVGAAAKEKVINAETGKDGFEAPYEVPLDVRTVGIAQLTAHGVPLETQAAMFDNWRTKLTAGQKQSSMQAWAAASQGSPEEVQAFLEGMRELNRLHAGSSESYCQSRRRRGRGARTDRTWPLAILSTEGTTV